jgi:hypothetical protein
MTPNPADWLLTSAERGNPATCLDDRHAGTLAWSAGNDVRPLVHGAAYFADLLAGVTADPAPLSRSPMRRLSSLLQREDTRADPLLPPQLPDPAPGGSHAVQLLRTYPRRRRGYVFAPDGERSIARSYLKVLQRARSLIYIEDQYLWSPQVATPFAEALAANPELCLIAVIPRFPDHDGRLSRPPSLVGHQLALEALYRGGGDRVAVRDRKPRRHPGLRACEDVRRG